jgi:hypothetical protein
MSISLTALIKKYNEENPKQYSLISLDYILSNTPLKILIEFAVKHQIPRVNPNDISQNELIYKILDYFYLEFNSKDLFKSKYPKGPDLITFLGDNLYHELPYLSEMHVFDFISRHELIDVFADYCSDLNIFCFQPYKNNEFGLSLYLTKKSRGVITTTESVFALTGLEINELYNEELHNKIQMAGKIGDWRVFITSPLGALRIGFDRLISDMKKLNAWLYIIDPIKKIVLGVLKGGKSKIRNNDLMEKYNQNLPQQPYRVPNQVTKLSKYKFNEKNAYKIKNIGKYSLEPHFFNESLISKDFESKKYSDIFQSLLIIENKSGLALYSYSKNENQINDIIISGFLSAIDSFGATISGSSGLEEINYKGFIINVQSSSSIKVIAILSTSPSESFKDRLKVFATDFEKKYHTQILEFAQTGGVDFQEETMVPFIQRLLAI